jgi:molybdate transport system permease protein
VLPAHGRGAAAARSCWRGGPRWGPGWHARRGSSWCSRGRPVVLAPRSCRFPSSCASARTALRGGRSPAGRYRPHPRQRPAAAFFRVDAALAWRGVLAGERCWPSRGPGGVRGHGHARGNIPGKTQTLALAIFHDNQIGRDDRAMVLAGR